LIKSPTIPRSGTLDTCTNYQELLHRGLKLCQEMGGDLWTDYNEHDPGVTILEQLCYALTDLSYRTDFEISDILAAPSGVRRPEQPLYTGDRILTTDPLTTADYRKLLYDRIRGLKNAWLLPITDHPLGIEGLYRVLVEIREELTSGAEAITVDNPEVKRVLEETRQLMRTMRNLGEDVEEIQVLQPQPIRVEATIEIRAKAEPANVLARVLFAIQNSLIPFPQVQLVDELFREMPPDQIWNGPMLRHGALDRDSLADRKTTIQVEEIAHIILDVPGVKRVKHLKAGNTAGPISSDKPILIEKDRVPRLDPPILQPQSSYTINVELEGGFKCVVNPRAVWSKIQELETGMRKNIAYAARSQEALAYLQPPQGKDRKMENYFSIQHHFPAVYGLSKYGAGSSLVEGSIRQLPSPQGKPPAVNARQARIRQLKAYLLLFEQPMADYLAQLSHVADLFSLDQELNRSYFYQPLAHSPALASEPPGIAEVLLQPAQEPQEKAYFLVYVVDRQGKIFFVSQRLAGNAQAEEVRRQIIESGQHPGNYRTVTLPSGEVRLALYSHAGVFLAQGQERFTSSAAAHEARHRWVNFMKRLHGVKPLHEKLVRISSRENLRLQIIDRHSRIVLTSSLMQTQEERERRIEDIFSSGQDPQNYRIRSLGPGKATIDLHNPGGNLIAQGRETFETEMDARDGIAEIAGLLRGMAHQPALRERHLRRLPEAEEKPQKPLQAYYDGLERIARQTDRDYLSRRNRILDHLLARFCERFDDAILERLDLRPFGEKDSFYRDLIRWKIKFLREYVERPGSPVALGAGRARGCNFEKNAATSGLERRVSLLLGIHGHSGDESYHSDLHRSAGPRQHYLEKEVRPVAPEQPGHPAQGARYHVAGPRLKDEPDLNDLHDHFVFVSEDSSIARLLLAAGTSEKSYDIQEHGGRHHIFFRWSHGGEAMEIHHTHSHQAAKNAVDALVRYFRRLRANTEECYAGEQMYVLEHLLLRPRRKATSPGGGHPTQDPFYSHRVSVLLPSWPMRFQNNEFRIYAEQLLYENAPAHLAVDCLWLSLPEMREFEPLFREWKSLLRAFHEEEHARADASALDEASTRLKDMLLAFAGGRGGQAPAHHHGKAGRK